MLILSPQQMDLLSRVARERFVQRLASYFALQWPAMLERLGDRYEAFIEQAVQHAQRHGLSQGPCVARYVNLWFVWGPGFEDKPGFEWAQAILSDARRSEFVKPHQLSNRTQEELSQRKVALSAADFAAVDARILEDLADLGRLGEVVPSTVHIPRLTCDLDAVDIGTIDTAWRHDYLWTQHDWQRVARTTPLPKVRLDTTQPQAPNSLTVLTHTADQANHARLQVKVRALGGCDGDTHPRVAFAGPHGLWQWRGHETRALSWPVHAPPPLPVPDGLGAVIAREEPPQLHTLEISSCALRDHGAPLGTVQTQVHSYPADQWLLELRHSSGPAACRLERDGVLQNSQGWQQGLSQLHQRFQEGCEQLMLAFERTSGATRTHLDIEPTLMSGQASFSWGWCEGPQGLTSPPVMRLQASLDLMAFALTLQLSGELSLAGAKARLHLRTQGSTPMRAHLLRDQSETEWPQALAPSVLTLRYPFELELDPIVTPDHVCMHPSTPATGAIVGEAGVRAKPGGAGVQLYMHLRVEPTATTLTIHDPLLGGSRQARPLLPAMTLLDWSLG